jgi:hypothetical protein
MLDRTESGSIAGPTLKFPGSSRQVSLQFTNQLLLMPSRKKRNVPPVEEGFTRCFPCLETKFVCATG